MKCERKAKKYVVERHDCGVSVHTERTVYTCTVSSLIHTHNTHLHNTTHLHSTTHMHKNTCTTPHTCTTPSTHPTLDSYTHSRLCSSHDSGSSASPPPGHTHHQSLRHVFSQQHHSTPTSWPHTTLCLTPTRTFPHIHPIQSCTSAHEQVVV